MRGLFSINPLRPRRPLRFGLLVRGDSVSGNWIFLLRWSFFLLTCVPLSLFQPLLKRAGLSVFK
jgi:hypothetical protein